jgi:hypothetical protein
MGHRNTPVVIAANVGGTGLFWTGQTWSEAYPDAHQYPNIDAARKEAGKTFARGDTRSCSYGCASGTWGSTNLSTPLTMPSITSTN